ncbi:hypothetical protein ACLOJK_008089 [Asimina triloba]
MEGQESEQPTGVASDNFNIDEDELDNVTIHMQGGISGMLATQSSQTCILLDPHVVKMKGVEVEEDEVEAIEMASSSTTSRGEGALTFFRWLDEMGQSMSGVDCVSQVQSESSAHKTEDIVADFGDLEDIRELKEAALRRDMEARVMKKTLATVICILVAIICYLAM